MAAVVEKGLNTSLKSFKLLFDDTMVILLLLDDEDEEDGDVSDHDSDNNGLQRQVPLPVPSSIKENILTKGKRKKRETTRKMGQKEIKHNKKKVCIMN